MTITKILPLTLLMATTALTYQVNAASEDAPTQGAYVTDEQRFYVEGQSVTEVIETANSFGLLHFEHAARRVDQRWRVPGEGL